LPDQKAKANKLNQINQNKKFVIKKLKYKY